MTPLDRMGSRRGWLISSLGVCLFFLTSTPTFSGSAPTKVVIAYSALNERGSGALLVARDAIRLFGLDNEKIRRLRAENLIDDSFVRNLEKEGLF